MIYSAARSQIRSGDLLFFRGTGLDAWAVRTWTHSPYSHVGIAWRIAGRVVVLESRPVHGGVTFDRTLSQALADGATWVPLETPWTAAMESRALEHLGAPYGWANDLRAALGLRVHGPAMECAEYASLVLGGVYRGDETPAGLFASFKGAPAYALAAG